MSDYSNRPEDVPAEDWVEQQEVADPAREEEEMASADNPRSSSGEADEADIAEQRTEVFLDDEED